MPPIDVSIVAPTYSGAHRLPRLFGLLLHQETTRAWEVIVVVDGTVDSTPEVVDEWKTCLPMHAVILATSQGVVNALNAGYAAARGRVVVRCDDDLTPGPNFVERHAHWHDEADNIAVIGPTRDVFPSTPYARAYGRQATEKALLDLHTTPPGQRWRHWAANNSVLRSHWEQVGGFDPRFRYGQDSEFGYRLAQVGCAFVIDDLLTVDHRGPSTRCSTRVPRAWVSGASRAAFDRKHPEAAIASPPAASSVKGRIWAASLSSLAAVEADRDRCRSVGRVLDATLPWMPAALATRAVAASVEAAARSGYRRGPDDLRSLADQKTAELAAELSLESPRRS